MLRAIREWFGSKTPQRCETCEALRSTIQVMKDHEAFLHQQIIDLESALLRATHLSPVAQTQSNKGPREPMSTMPPTWGTVKRQLEERHRRKPENPHADAVANHWGNKISELEGSAGLNTQSS